MLEEILEESGAERVLLIGIGGGGDIVSTIHLYNRLRLFDVGRLIGSIPWERYIVDPAPGPISPQDLRGSIVLSYNTHLATPTTMACRAGLCFYIQASKVSRNLGTPVLLNFIDRGARGLVNSLYDAVTFFNVDLVIGVDAGGDVLAEGSEEGLASPLADQVGLAGLAELERKYGVKTLIAVHGLGCDGEIPVDTLLKRLSFLAEKGAVLGFEGITKWDVGIISEALRGVDTEASRLPLEAFRGRYGLVKIRRGTREVLLNVLSATTVFLDTLLLYRYSRLARLVAETTSIEEARLKLNMIGVYTELDLERDLAATKTYDVVQLRRQGKKRLAYFLKTHHSFL